MKLEKIAFSAILITLVSMNLVIASHAPSLSMTPSQWATSTDSDVSLMVSNGGADGITEVELVIPESSMGVPLYMLKEVSKPAGWTYETAEKYEQDLPYKITWSTTGSGISSGSSQNFGFKVTSPSEVGDYTWQVTTVDSSRVSVVNHVATSTGGAPLSKFEITGEPQQVKAGNSFRVTVKALNSNGEVKTDYIGSISFGSSDEKAALPEEYKFKKSNNGVKTFEITFKTIGERVVLISDSQLGVSKISDVVKVVPGDFSSLKILPDGLEVEAGTKVEFIAAATDLYDNSLDVTGDLSWSIDDNAGGDWEDNFYIAENPGIWTVVGENHKLADGATLRVREKAPVVQTTVPEVPEIPTEEPEPEEPTEEEVPVVEPVPTVELSVSGSDVVVVEAGSDETTVITVENTGNTDLTGVKLSYVGVSGGWIDVLPDSEDLKVGESKEFLVAITVPENTSETQTVTFTVSSNEGASATMESTLYAGTAPTGIFTGISKNLLQLAVVVIAVATVVIIVWELWFRK
jgi:uncharacterized protein YcnI